MRRRSGTGELFDTMRSREPPRFGDETSKQRAGRRADLDTAFRMPLNAEQKRGRRPFLDGLPLESFDHAIVGASRHNSQALPRTRNGLVVTCVDRQTEIAGLLKRLTSGQQVAQQTSGRDEYCMGDGNFFPGRMVHRKGQQILHQGPSVPHVQGLQAEADAQQGFALLYGMFDEQIVAHFPEHIRSRRLRIGCNTVSGGAKIGWAPGQKKTLHIKEKTVNLPGLLYRQANWLTTSEADRMGVLWPGTPVVLRIAGGRDRNGDTRHHASSVSPRKLPQKLLSLCSTWNTDSRAPNSARLAYRYVRHARLRSYPPFSTNV